MTKSISPAFFVSVFVLFLLLLLAALDSKGAPSVLKSDSMMVKRPKIVREKKDLIKVNKHFKRRLPPAQLKRSLDSELYQKGKYQKPFLMPVKPDSWLKA
ncbi:MAG: hypothetical protein ACJ75J_15200 [Cytophagaceae bacterium]